MRTTPSGETWALYIDPESQLPVLVQAVDAKGELLERYVFRNPRYDLPELAQADAFDPNLRWGPAQGIPQPPGQGQRQPTTRTPPPHSPDNCQSGDASRHLCQGVLDAPETP